MKVRCELTIRERLELSANGLVCGARQRPELLDSIEADHSVEQELELFPNREGRYASDWVPLEKSGRELFVRYDQIVLVSQKT